VRVKLTGVAVAAVMALGIAAAQPRVAATPRLASRPDSGTVEILSSLTKADLSLISGKYVSGVIKKTKENWYRHMPRKARPPWLEDGKVAIRFEIRKNGKVSHMALASPSGDAHLDRAAWTAIRRSSPYAPFPQGTTAREIEFQFWFFYNEQPPGSLNASAVNK